MIEILMADDHPIFRSGMRRLLSDENDMRVLAEASNGLEAIALLRQQRFGVVLLDINMGGRSGLETLRRIRAEWPAQPVIMLSMYPEEQYAGISLQAGANGYLSKDRDAADLLAAIRMAAAGGCYIPAATAAGFPCKPEADESLPPHQRLTEREWEIMRLIVKGISLTEIGSQLSLSVKTISTYRHRLLAKLDLENNADLVRYCLQARITD